MNEITPPIHIYTRNTREETQNKNNKKLMSILNKLFKLLLGFNMRATWQILLQVFVLIQNISNSMDEVMRKVTKRLARMPTG